MEKEFCIKALQRLKDNQGIHMQFSDLGLDATVFFDKTGYISLLEESIATIICNDDENKFEQVLDLINWWLYDQPNKVFYYDDKPDLDVNKAEDFVNCLIHNYGN